MISHLKGKGRIKFENALVLFVVGHGLGLEVSIAYSVGESVYSKPEPERGPYGRGKLDRIGSEVSLAYGG